MLKKMEVYLSLLFKRLNVANADEYPAFNVNKTQLCTSWTCRVVRLLPRTIVCIYSVYKEAPEDGPMSSETCRAET